MLVAKEKSFGSDGQDETGPRLPPDQLEAAADLRLNFGGKRRRRKFRRKLSSSSR